MNSASGSGAADGGATGGAGGTTASTTGGGFGTADDFAEKEAIGIDREVVAVLFDSGDGDNDWDVFVEGLYGRPG